MVKFVRELMPEGAIICLIWPKPKQRDPRTILAVTN